MEPRFPEHEDHAIGAMLRTARPSADPAFVARAEARLFAPRRTWLPAWRPAPALRLGSAFALGLAVLMLVLALADAGPLGGSSQPVVADDDCRTVRVTRTERVPRLVQADGAQPRIVYETRRVQRLERRCR